MTRNFNLSPGTTWRDVEGPDDAAAAAERHFEQEDARDRERRDDAVLRAAEAERERQEQERAFNQGIQEGIERRMR